MGERTTIGVAGGEKLHNSSWELFNEEPQLPGRTGENRA